ncbi:hypothetical protein [Haloarcula vallismortis]|nr:hypothetical protein [Haloarcula vallismortis]
MAYFIQETHESGTEYISMIRRRDHVFDCEREAVEALPKQEL